MRRSLWLLRVAGSLHGPSTLAYLGDPMAVVLGDRDLLWGLLWHLMQVNICILIMTTKP